MKGLVISVVEPEQPGVPGRYAVGEFDGGLDELQAAVGGWVEVIPSNPSITMWVNEEGKLERLPINRLAMDVWLRWDDYHCQLIGNDWIAGNAVITGSADDAGESRDLPAAARRWVLAVAADAGAELPA